MAEPILQVRDLCVRLSGRLILDHVSFDVLRGRTLGVVGESGSGKSVTASALMGLVPIASGSVKFGSREVAGLSERAWRALRGRQIAMVFQDPMSAFLPVRSVGAQIDEQIRAHERLSRTDARARTVQLLQRMEVPDAAQMARRYPHQLSGGLRQRAMIAMALSCRPDLLIADEPTTALDVTVQAQILALLREVSQRDAGVMLITHDMGVVAQSCADVVVMYAGVIVERGSVETILQAPLHPYTQALMAATPEIDGPRPARLATIPGQPPSPASRPQGCVFQPRCGYAHEACGRRPPLRSHAGRDVACVLYEGAA
ncbi:ABC transporter ATP-binding protein [Tanticharoenia sakaeratensis]|uniref:Oligopeptide ABC transporter ATP-binding protein OppD n=1 Tax=Tanticharoenia sakaeratensis NBRC 103193 TaxID=1231623 RepID=A0A0D6MKJ4_9PROT|nr:ABC transporter ATP-binding protein [Tanticharoenia sakaeratensis]GAN54162.1 oligopeptide ABC transporter ATP-binding protein OppD [Tanticharoenia sakaeratensis NBRC 103193]GBQ19413.1 peptide ABC transporter ATP-binding protein [Tanticharoenia sakaeratensis NBRC 103193]